MKFLIFLLGIIFYFIFFLFSLEKGNSYNSLLGSLFIEAHIYIATSLIFLFFLFISRRAQKEISPLGDDDENGYQLNITRNDILKFVGKFFTQFAYILAILLFYLGIGLMFQSIVGSFHIPIMFLLFNILVLGLFFIEHKFMVFQDFLRINTGIISIYYIFIHIYYILGGSIALGFYDIVNIVLLFVLFYFFLRTERKSQYKYIMQSYVIAFIFLEVLVVLKYFFSFEPTLYSFMSGVFAMIFFVFPQQLNQQFKIHIFLSRIWGIVFSYFFLIFLSISLFDINLGVIILCLVSFLISLILLEFHKKFENYVALLGASYGSFIGLLGLFLAFLNQDFIEHYITIFLYFISLIYLIFDVVRKKSYVYDSYFFHVFSLLVNLSCLISFFFFIDFSILNTGLFLIAESLYFFYSYFSLRKTFKKGSTIS